MSKYLGIDLGTQSLKVLVYNADTRAIESSGSAELQLTSRPDGTREQQADWWTQALQLAMEQVDAASRASVAAIGVSGQQHGFTPVSANGEVLAPVKLWCDTATTAECEEISEAFGGAGRCASEVGNAILPGYTAPKIRWLRNNNRAAYDAMASIMLPHDYLNFYLTGERFMECGDASGTGLLDIRSRHWHSGMLTALDADRDLSDCLPRLIGPGDIGGSLLPAIAELLGLPTGIPVACGGGDNMMAALGTGNVATGRLTMSLGTSGTMFAYSDSPCIDPKGDLAAFCSSNGGWLPLLCTMNCTVATELARDLFRMEVSSLEQLISGSQPGAHGVVVLPFYNGERSPNLPNGKGCIMGLDVDNMNQANIMRASMESAVFGLRTGLDAFDRVACDISDIRLTGGGSRSQGWRQIIADTFGLPVRVLQLDEGAALGAAMNAMLLHQGIGDQAAAAAALIDEHIRFDESQTAVPNPATADIYQHAYQRYLQHVDLVTPLFK